jgi:uncharacterized membrane protein YhaH (DUF805 family)
MIWYLETFRKYAVFAGRASRKEFWPFFLFNLFLIFAFCGIDHLAGTWYPESHTGLISLICGSIILIPTIAVTVRRLHDIDRRGWWDLILFIPLAGIIPFLLFMAEDSQPGENKYGPSPKMESANNEVHQIW